MKFLKYCLLGAAFAAPINAAVAIDAGKLKSAEHWCIAVSVEVSLIFILEIVLQIRENRMRFRNRGSRIYEL